MGVLNPNGFMGKYPIMFIHVSQFQMECDIQMIASHWGGGEGVGILSKSCKDWGEVERSIIKMIKGNEHEHEHEHVQKHE